MKPQRPQKALFVTSGMKKEAGAAGGESDARSYGPALGGRPAPSYGSA